MSYRANRREYMKRKKRIRIIKGILIGLGVGVIILQVLFLVDVIPMPKALQKQEETVTGTDTRVVVNNLSVCEEDATDCMQEKRTYTKYVFVGDSRYVGMSEFKQDGDVFLARNNMGYDYLVEQLPNIYSVCDENTALIVGLGVNDMNYGRDKYIAKLNELADQLDCQIYYMSVNPVDETKGAANGYTVWNSKIDEFNAKLKSSLSEKIIYIDTNSYLKQMTFTTTDGLHYNKGTYQLIYDYIKASL